MSSTDSSNLESKPEDEDSKIDRCNLLSQDLKEFYANHNVELSGLLNTTKEGSDSSPFPYRFIRLNPRYDKSETLKLLKEEMEGGKVPLQVHWLDEKWGFFALPADFPLASSKSFRSGRVYGMDVSSGAGAAALLSTMYDKKAISDSNSEKNEIRVLDLCCCPGLKLCVMADFLKDKSATIVGVDVSKARMAVCKKIVQKYHIDKDTSGTDYSPSGEVNIQMYCQDGTTFGLDLKNDDSSSSKDVACAMNLVFDSRIALEETATRGKRKRMNKSARARERKRLRQCASKEWLNTGSTAENDNTKINLFDHVLVDAECSTDGSLKHMKERMKESSAKEEKNLMLTDQLQLAELVALQKRLIASGFRLLKPGGNMVYSTCSLSQEQNESVVKWLLDNHNEAYLVPVHFPLAKSKLVVEGSLDGTVRFYPNLAQTSSEYFGDGFFLSKIGKRQTKRTNC